MSKRPRKPPKPVRVHVQPEITEVLNTAAIRLCDEARAAATARWLGRVHPERLLRHILRLRLWISTWGVLFETISFSTTDGIRYARAHALYAVLCDEAAAHGIQPPWANCSEAEAWFQAERDQIRDKVRKWVFPTACYGCGWIRNAEEDPRCACSTTRA